MGRRSSPGQVAGRKASIDVRAAAYWLAGRGGGNKELEDVDSGRALPIHAKALISSRCRGGKKTSRHLRFIVQATSRTEPSQVCSDIDPELRTALWRAAAQLADGIRTLFNRMDVMFLLDQLYRHPQPCTVGAVLRRWQPAVSARRILLPADLSLADLVSPLIRSVRSPIARSGNSDTSHVAIQRTDVDRRFTKGPITVRFALRYGAAAKDAESVRAPEVRNAFNGPFWPFVLASTSVGQEGNRLPLVEPFRRALGCRRDRSTLSNVRPVETASVDTPFERTSRQRTAGKRSYLDGAGEIHETFRASCDHRAGRVFTVVDLPG